MRFLILFVVFVGCALFTHLFMVPEHDISKYEITIEELTDRVESNNTLIRQLQHDLQREKDKKYQTKLVVGKPIHEIRVLGIERF